VERIEGAARRERKWLRDQIGLWQDKKLDTTVTVATPAVMWSPRHGIEPDLMIVAAVRRISCGVTSISLRVDADVLDWFKAQGPGYQMRMNVVLRAFKEASL